MELFDRYERFAAHDKISRRLPPLRIDRDGQIGRDIVADLPITAPRPLDEQSIAVMQDHRQPVDLGLDDKFGALDAVFDADHALMQAIIDESKLDKVTLQLNSLCRVV